MRGNPYTPGAGCTPMYLAGRENILAEAQTSLELLSNCIPQRSCLYYGLRGVGKTVLLNTIEGFAENNDLLCVHLEASEKEKFLGRLLSHIHSFLREMSISESAKALKDRLVRLIASFALVYDLKEYTYSLEISPDETIATGIIGDDFTAIFTSLGKLAAKCERGIVFLIDEVQFLEKEHLQPLIAALHRCNQLRLPIMIFAAGLPKAISVINASCSYAERLFVYNEVGRLSSAEAEEAIVEPAKIRCVEYTEEAVEEIIHVTEGYPYFIQEFCSTIWNKTEDCSQISLDNVERSKGTFYQKLDKGFFEARYSRCSGMEKSFLLAMSSLDSFPCASSEVAKVIGKTMQQVSPARGTLINKGIIYAPERGYVDFTVPLFDQYLKRVTIEE